MTQLKDKLDSIRTSFKAKAPAATLEVMQRATDDLRNSGIMDRVIKPGATLPAFALPNTDGEILRSEDLLAKGPLIATFYRGLW